MSTVISNKLRAINSRLHPKHLYYQPNWIVLGVNNVCNLHCKMCDVGTQNLDSTFAQNLVGTHPLNMPQELTKSIIAVSYTHLKAIAEDPQKRL